MSYKFHKDLRLRKRAQYLKLNNSSLKFVGKLVYIYFRMGNESVPKLGITVSSKFGKAYLRNSFKRRVREAFRHSHHLLPKNIELNVAPKIKSQIPSILELKDDLLSIKFSK